jgi:hypothetical protein
MLSDVQKGEGARESFIQQIHIGYSGNQSLK